MLLFVAVHNARFVGSVSLGVGLDIPRDERKRQEVQAYSRNHTRQNKNSGSVLHYVTQASACFGDGK
jgi:hypothetical protein